MAELFAEDDLRRSATVASAADDDLSAIAAVDEDKAGEEDDESVALEAIVVAVVVVVVVVAVPLLVNVDGRGVDSALIIGEAVLGIKGTAPAQAEPVPVLAASALVLPAGDRPMRSRRLARDVDAPLRGDGGDFGRWSPASPPSLPPLPPPPLFLLLLSFHVD